MTTLKEQIITINPSIPPALFRYLMREDSVSYLRENDGVYGFEVSTDSTLLSGLALIGMRKLTIPAYRSEDDNPRLVIFPPLSKLFDTSLGLLGLTVTKYFFTTDDFSGEFIAKGQLIDLVKDLTPPEKVVDIPEAVTEQMMRVMLSEYEDQEVNNDKPVKVTRSPKLTPPVLDELPTDTPPLDNPYFDNDDEGSFDDYGSDDYGSDYSEYAEYANDYDYDHVEPAPLPDMDLPSPSQTVDAEPVNELTSLEKRLSDAVFTNEHDIIDLMVTEFGARRELMIALLNALLPKTQGFSTKDRVHQFKQLVIKAHEKGRLS